MDKSKEYWSVKRNAYACVCITPDIHGTAVIWESQEEAWHDAKERVEEFIREDFQRFKYQKVYDGYEVINKYRNNVIRYYKVFEVQELE